MVDTEPAVVEIESSLATPATTPPYKIERTRPDVLLRHDISEEELDKLAETRRDYLWEGKWVALGVCLGVAPAGIGELVEAYWANPGDPLTVVDLIQVIIFFASAVAFLILWGVMKRKSSDAGDLATAIRERTAQQV